MAFVSKFAGFGLSFLCSSWRDGCVKRVDLSLEEQSPADQAAWGTGKKPANDLEGVLRSLWYFMHGSISTTKEVDEGILT